LAAPKALTSDFDIIINEVHYNPLTGLTKDEFVELYNRGPTAVNLAGWRFSEGISLTFLPGTAMDPKTYLVVSSDASYTQARHGILNVTGNYSGKLDNNGEILTLVNAAGDVMSSVHYGDGGVWPSRPDGLGPSLELLDPHAQPDIPRSWASSLFIDGTPGRSNSRTDPSGPSRRNLVSAQDLWRYFKGTQEPSNPLGAWAGASFNDLTWETGAGPFGYGGGSVETELTDMQGLYSTLYLRAKFSLSASELQDLQSGDSGLSLNVSFDDAFVAYLNGVEVARQNAGTPGTFRARDSVADSSLSSQVLINLDSFLGALVQGQNTLALQGFNHTLASPDFFLETNLVLGARPPPVAETASPVVINEVKPTEAGSPGFIEILNSSSSSVSLAGHVLMDSSESRKRFTLGNVSVPGGGRLVLTDGQLGFSTSIGNLTYALAKPEAGRDLYVDALATRPGRAGEHGYSFGRFPDAGEDTYVLVTPTQGTANQAQLPADVIINEIHFHPLFVAPNGGCIRKCSDVYQWIEIHNRGASAADVSGWSLSKAVDLTLPASTSLPAGGFLILAASPTDFLASHPGFDPAKVFGPWTKRLAHDSDTINLNDSLQNRVDHVKYGDGKPINDLAPADGSNDLTFLGSTWPPESDGTGRTIELIHPRLDNRDGAAWAAGPPGGTPGAANSSFQAVPAAVVDEVEHSPAVPRPSQAVTVKCQVSATQAIASVEAIWHREGAGGGGTIPLLDNGLSGDGAAGDGEFAGTLPAQPDTAIIAFQVRCHLADGKVTTVPKAPQVPPYAGFTGPFFLYQVIAASPPINPSENYYIVMTLADQNELQTRPAQSNVLLPCTFLHVEADGRSDIRYSAGIRYRGEATRGETPKPYRIDFASDRRFQDIEHLDLNSSHVEREILVSDFFRRAGLPYPVEWTVNLTFQGSLDPRYVRKEHFDADVLDRLLGGGSSSGNFYRAIDPQGDPRSGDLTYYGENQADYVNYYDKKTNKEENDYADIVELCRAFDPVQTPADVFPAAVESLVDVDEWARFFAAQACISNVDGGIHSTSGEDYFLYKIPDSSPRPNAGKWIIMPWDIEETFQNANEPLFRPSLVTVRRFLTHPQFAPLYYGQLANLRAGAFSRFETRQRFPLINFIFGFGTIDGIDTFITARNGFLDSNVPTELSAGAVSTILGPKLVSVGDTWKYWEGSQAPAGGPLGWTQRAYAETDWLSGPTGIGYGDGDDATVLANMEGSYTTVFARRTFSVPDPATIQSMDLTIDYDDGFVAYLNGAEVARRNAPGPAGTPVPFDATASQTHEAGTVETISLSAFLNALVAGNNVLAIQALNQDIASTDLSLIPELSTGGTPSGGLGCGTVLYATTDSIGLSGRSNAYLTRSVKVKGALAAYDAFRATWSASVSLGPGDNLIVVEAFDGDNGIGNLVDSKTVTVRHLSRDPLPVSGNLTGVTRWTKANGPYLMTGNVTVPAGSRLEIDAGTLVIGEAGASIIVHGEMQAIGSAADPILFRALSCTNRWGGIALDNTGVSAASPTHTLRYCDLEFGDNPAGFAGCVSPVSSKLLVDHSSLRFLTANGVDGISARVEVRDSTFEQINEGVHCNNSTVIVVDCTFRGMIGDKDAIDFDGNGTERSLIEGCLMEDGSDDGIDLQATTVDIRNNIFRNISDKAMSLEEDGPLGGPTITGNLVYNSGTGLALKSGIHIAEAHHNTIVGCQEGINLFAKAGAPDGGHGTFHSMIVWNNIADVKLDALSSATFAFSDVSTDAPAGLGNISSDPKFTNVLAENFALRPTSPCIGSGKDTSDMGAIPFTSGSSFVRADSDSSGVVNITDAIVTLDYLFRGAVSPRCLDSADANDDGQVDIVDPVFTILALFAGGAQPPTPYPAAGTDPTPDGLGCQ
jgi:hypothetical protein